MQHAVQRIELALHRVKQRLGPHDEEGDQRRGDHQHRREGEGQARAGADHERQAAHDHEGRAGPDAQGHLGQVLECGHVAGETNQELTGVLAVEVAVREALYPQEDGLAQIAGHGLAHPHRVDVVSDGDEGARHRDSEHEERGLGHHPAVAEGYPLVDDPLDEPRDGEIEDHEHGEQCQGRQRRSPVGTDEAQETEQGLRRRGNRGHRAGV